VPVFRYRAATAAGDLRAGTLEGVTRDAVITRLRQQGLLPIEAIETGDRSTSDSKARASSGARNAVVTTIGELSVLLGAGLTLDRALTVCLENVQRAELKRLLGEMRGRIVEGMPLSQAMREAHGLFSPMACAMAEAGAASGKLDLSLARLAETLERAAALRQTIVSALVYPILLFCMASGVILVMLLVVVPQFASLLGDSYDKLPFATRVILNLSVGLRQYGLLIAAGAMAVAFLIWRWLQTRPARMAFDAIILRVPLVGDLLRDIETARFSRTLGSLVQNGVALPTALAISERAIVNTRIAQSIARIANGLKEGNGLAAPLAAAKVFRPMAISFLRTGEETAQLGLMLDRLADVLDRDVRVMVDRIIAVMTPAITVVMGGIVATVIASVMSAILGFNDLAVGP
jgi:general secretion pathway protein F